MANEPAVTADVVEGQGQAQAQDSFADTFLDMDTSQVPDAKILPESTYIINLKKIEKGDSKKGEPMLTCVYEVPGEPTVDDLYYYVVLPSSTQDEKAQIRNLRGLKEWKEAHGVAHTGQINLQELVQAGIQVNAAIGVEAYQGKNKNRINNLLGRAN